MELTADLSPERRSHVEGRLRSNLIARLTTVDPSGQPVSVPVWFLLREDETFLVYSQPTKAKLRNLAGNPHVSLTLDVTDVGRDVIRVHGIAEHLAGLPSADHNAAYRAKYAERIGTLFGTAEEFAAAFSAPLVITPTRLWA